MEKRRKARGLDEETLKIDGAIDCLIYDLYDLTEEEINLRRCIQCFHQRSVL